MSLVKQKNKIERYRKTAQIHRTCGIVSRSVEVAPSAIGRDPMKFRNGDVSLDDAIVRNGGKVEWAGVGILADSSW